MQRMGLSGLIMVAAAAASSGQTRAGEVRISPNGDGSGDKVYEHRCPAGRVLVGFSGRRGLWIDAIQTVCAPLDASGRIGQGTVDGPVFGGAGGGAQDAYCPAGSTLEQFTTGHTYQAKQVASIHLTCRNQSTGAVDYSRTFGNPNYSSQTDSFFIRNDQFVSYPQTQVCPGGLMPVGIFGNVGDHLNRIGLICDNVARPAPPPPPPPQVERPVTKTARAPVASGPPVALRQTISGPWKLAFAGSGTYLFQIIASGTGVSPFGRDEFPVGIQGTFTELGGAADSGGGFGGQMDAGRQMLVQYGRKNGTAGVCQLLYATDAKSIVGTCSEKDGETYKVTGSRASAADVAAAQQVPAPAAAAAPAARGQAVTVVQAVDYYTAAGGNGEAAGSLEAGTSGVTLLEPCNGDWCHVAWPGHEGWVYNADDYRSLRY